MLRVYAFIDSQNLNLDVKDTGWNIDFKRFRIYLKEKLNVSRAYLFIGHVPGNSKLYEYLQESGFIIIFKPTLEFTKRGRRIIKGNVDAELVLHTIIHISDYDKAVIVSGDGDFHCLVEYLEEKQKLGKIIAPSRKYSSLLRKFARHIVSVQDFRKKVETDQ